MIPELFKFIIGLGVMALEEIFQSLPEIFMLETIVHPAAAQPLILFK